MSNSKNTRNNEKKRLQKQRLLFQMKKEIESLEKQIKYSKLTNLKISSIKNLKISGRVLQFVAPYFVTVGIVTGGFKLLGDTPFYPNDEYEAYSNIMTEFDNLGNIRYEQQYGKFANSENTLYSYSKWQLQEDGFYSRIVKTYDIKKKTYEEILELFNKEDLSLEDLFGECSATIKESKQNLSEEEISENAFLQAVIYNEDKDDYILVKETTKENIILSILFILLTIVAELIPLYIRTEVSSFNFCECVEKLNRKYKPIDMQELTRKLEIRRDNYNRMKR